MWICAEARVLLLKSRACVSILASCDVPHHQDEKDMDNVESMDVFRSSFLDSSMVVKKIPIQCNDTDF
jgi:hypothetical protein